MKKKDGEVKETLSEFSGWTSAHGIPHIGRSKHTCMIVFWTIITLIAFGLLLWQVVLLVIRYLRYDVTVGMELKFERRGFPAVTICDLNPYKVSTLSSHQKIQDLMRAYELALTKAPCRVNCTLAPVDQALLVKYGLEDIVDSVALQAKTRDLLVMVMEGLAASERAAISNPKEALIKGCSFNTKDCSVETDFITRQDAKMGSCYTFNGVHPSRFETSRAGPLYGLRLIVFSDTSDYLPITESAGFRVVIHNQTQEAFPDTFGYNVEVGSGTSMGVSYRHIMRLESPYGNCVSVAEMKQDYQYDGAYTSEGCQRTCFQRQVEGICKCSDPNYPQLDQTLAPCKAEDKTQRECWYSLVTSTSGDQEVDCSSCNLPCTEGVFDVTVSAASWPSPSTIKIADCIDSDVPEPFTNCIDYYSKNGAMVEVFYEQLNYQELNESPAYEFVNLASDFGGQIGLWLGLSAISIIEFVVLLVQICYVCGKPKSDSDIPPSPKKQQSY